MHGGGAQPPTCCTPYTAGLAASILASSPGLHAPHAEQLDIAGVAVRQLNGLGAGGDGGLLLVCRAGANKGVGAA